MASGPATKRPDCITPTRRRRSRKTSIFRSGLPSTSRRSASFPGATVPICVSKPINRAAADVDVNFTSEQLRDLFTKAGTVHHALMVPDAKNGRTRGFGFVEMADDDAANAAIAQFNGQEYDGRNIVVNEARPREDNRGGGGGGGRRGGGGGGYGGGGNRW